MLQWIRNRYWSDCYLFFSTKSQQFLRMFGPFSQSSPFLVSFYTLDFLFSPSYLIMVPVFTIMFKINYKKIIRL